MEYWCRVLVSWMDEECGGEGGGVEGGGMFQGVVI